MCVPRTLRIELVNYFLNCDNLNLIRVAGPPTANDIVSDSPLRHSMSDFIAFPFHFELLRRLSEDQIRASAATPRASVRQKSRMNLYLACRSTCLSLCLLFQRETEEDNSARNYRGTYLKAQTTMWRR